MEAIGDYEEENYEMAASKLEHALIDYYATFRECQMLCFHTVEQEHFDGLYKRTSRMYQHAIDILII